MLAEAGDHRRSGVRAELGGARGRADPRPEAAGRTARAERRPSAGPQPAPPRRRPGGAGVVAGGSSCCSPCRSASCSATCSTRPPCGSSSPPASACCRSPGYMGEATEHLAHRTGPTVGGLLNATFGNAAELIIAIVALRAGLVDLVKASITGSILGNLLLILGLSLIAGGHQAADAPVQPHQRRDERGRCWRSRSWRSCFPALFHAAASRGGGPARRAAACPRRSRSSWSSPTCCSLLFTLRTHRAPASAARPHPTGRARSGASGKAVAGARRAPPSGVAVESELLVHAVDRGHRARSGCSQIFLGLIIIPIIGNAAEHATAVVLSRKGQIDLALQIALGLEHPGRAAGGAAAGLRRRAAGPGHEPGLHAVRGRGPGAGHRRRPPSSRWTANRTGSRGCSCWRCTRWWRSAAFFSDLTCAAERS